MTKIKEGESYACPVCGKYEFSDQYEYCKVCGWCHDLVQEDYPDEDGCSNHMSLNQAREAYKHGEKVE